MEARVVTTFVCRNCHADLDTDQRVCHQCGAAVEDTQPPSDSPASGDRLLDRPWFVIVLLLHVGVLGIPAFWQTKYSLATRVLIVIASILYTLFAIVVIIWGVQMILRLL